MSYYTRAFDLVTDLKEDIDYEFRGKVKFKTVFATWASSIIYFLLDLNPFASPISASLSVSSMGPNVYLPAYVIHKPETLYLQLMKERKRLRLYSNLGFGNLWLGWVVYCLACVFPFPLLFAVVRFHFETLMMKEVIRGHVILYGHSKNYKIRSLIKADVSYPFKTIRLFLTPGDLNAWFDRVYDEVLKEEGLIKL